MKKTAIALASLAIVMGSAVNAQVESTTKTVTVPATEATEAAQIAGQKVVVDMPVPESRRRMLIDCGLFGMGIHVGWMKPKSAINAQVSDHHIGMPIFNVSAGTKALGVGTK